MDEDIDVEKNKDDLDEKLREAVSGELSSYVNPQPTSNSAVKTPVKPIIRTYKSDMEETIEAGHLSSINMAISENKKMMGRMKQGISEIKKSPVRSGKLNKNIIIISLVLVAGGAAAIFVPYFLVQKQNAPSTVASSTITALTQSIMTTDIEEKINIKDINLNGIDTTLKQRVDQSATNLGQIKDFVLTKGNGTNEAPILASEFLTMIKADVPPAISRNLLPQYMFGMHNYNGNQEFLILKVSSYDTTFSGMLLWETDLWQNFKNLFGLSDTAGSETPIASTSGQNSFGITVKRFQDAEFANKDCRVVKDDSGNIVFLYSIINPSTVVITTSSDTLKEIISRTSRINTVTQ